MARTTAGVGFQDHSLARSETSEWDALSRLPCRQCGCTGEDDKNNESATIATLQLSSYVSANIKDKQMEDQTLQLIITAKQSNERITPAQEAAQSLELRRLLQIWDQPTVSNGVLYRLFLDTSQPSGTRCQLVVPQCMRDNVLKEVHEGAMGGHLGEEKALQNRRNGFTGLGTGSLSGSGVEPVPPAVNVKHQHINNREPLQGVAMGSPMQFMAVDILGPLRATSTSSGNENVLVAGTTLLNGWRHTRFPIRKQ